MGNIIIYAKPSLDTKIQHNTFWKTMVLSRYYLNSRGKYEYVLDAGLFIGSELERYCNKVGISVISK